MFGKKLERSVEVRRDVMDSILSYCRIKHPNEGVLVLKGRSKRGLITVDGLVIPPFSESGPSFAGFPHSFLPFDLSYVGMVHSHPSGPAEPSLTDLHNFFGLVSVIVGFPYEDGSVYAWDSGGRRLPLSIYGDPATGARDLRKTL
ncbi:MAG: Mov34/MPN/PAD-1 family protein [Nitrosopumilus sp.]|nr:Mov34/MPN/PAD-1 family protein [Nitrosopumilus sp.]CAI9831445.1 Mov34/MPN/PAD-1 family protein [Nitrosopumilaceae archaeon]MDA7940825.1 Mov34/MPN/PAD-1 family protein [Nitrosopumilus sp.]MDA7943319.1 Mov34/MPN/PAD-1 family protein [Nitrosopumilus sp.]MDA7945698.1 Mov34/MPN/PAD-1 family protein [Nitrosopumilus sp.]